MDMPKYLTTMNLEAARRAERLPGYILALANTELNYQRMLEQDVNCDVCGAHCSRQTTPVFQYQLQELFFCQTCSQALID